MNWTNLLVVLAITADHLRLDVGGQQLCSPTLRAATFASALMTETLRLPAGRDDNFGTVSFVQANPHFNKDCVTFVFGPTQKTVPNYDFRDVSLDFVFLDGINIPTLANFFRFLRDDANVETDFRSRKYGLL